MTCVFDDRWIGDHGIGRFARELAKRLKVKPLLSEFAPMSPFDPFILDKPLLKWSRDPGNWFFSPGYNGPLRSKIPYVITLHDLNHIDRTENSSVAKRIYYRSILKRVARRSAAIFTVSNFSKDRILEWLQSDDTQVFNIGNGISEVFFREARHDQSFSQYVLCVSNRKGHKNEFRAVTAFAQAYKDFDCELVFTGTATDELQAHIDDEGVSLKVRFAGHTSDAELAKLYRNAAVLLFPSLYEGFGLPIVEAFASGTPVITSNASAMPEISGGASLLVNPLNVEEIACALSQIRDNSILRTSLIRAGKIRAREFTWDAVSQRVLDAVEQINCNSKNKLSW